MTNLDSQKSVGERLLDRSAQILIVDPSESYRMSVRQVLASLGFSTISTAPSLEGVLGAHRDVDWILSSLFARDSINIFHVLKDILQGDRLRAVSVMLDQSEWPSAPWLYQEGAFCCLAKVGSPTDLTESFELILKHHQSHHGDCQLTSARYLFQTLGQFNAAEDLLAVAEKMAQIYPHRSSTYLDLAYANYRNDFAKPAGRYLRRACTLNAACTKTAAKMMLHFEQKQLDLDEVSLLDLGVNHVVVVEPDDAAARMIIKQLEGMGASYIQHFTDGREACSVFEEKKLPDLWIQEWRLPELSGNALVQRLRNVASVTTPVLVTSSLLTAEDDPLLGEVFVAHTLQKPLQREELQKKIIATASEKVNDKKPTQLADRIYQLLFSGNESAALDLFATQQAALNPGLRVWLQGEFSYLNRDYNQALGHAKKSIAKLGSQSLRALNLLSKILIKQGSYDAAMKIMGQAHQFSPQNIQHILDLAELKLAGQQPKEANELVEQAQSIDPEYVRTVCVAAKASVAMGDRRRASQLLTQLDDKSLIVSYLNNRAVVLARTGEFDTALKLYDDLLASLPEGQDRLLHIVTYNRSLCCFRNQHIEQGLADLQKISHGTGEIADKAKALHGKVQTALQAGKSINLAAQEVADQYFQPNEDLSELFASLKEFASLSESKKWCMHGKFKPSRKPDSLTASLLPT